jgi:hypothetical protein
MPCHRAPRFAGPSVTVARLALLYCLALTGCKTLDSARDSLGMARGAPAADAGAPDSPSDRVQWILPNYKPVFDPIILASPLAGVNAMTNGCYVRGSSGFGKPGSTLFADYLFGMTPQQVVQLLGPPAQQHYGKASRITLTSQQLAESFRLEMLYPGKGRLIFGLSTLAQHGCSGLRVQFIIHNPSEPARMKRENAHLFAYDGPPPVGAVPNPAPGLSATGEVLDTWKLELGYGNSLREKATRSDEPGAFSGEIFGKPAADSLFASVQVGMPCGTALKTMEQEPDVIVPAPPGLRRMLDGQNANYHALVYTGMGALIVREPRFQGPAEIVAIVNNHAEKAATVAASRVATPPGCVHRYVIQDGPRRR